MSKPGLNRVLGLKELVLYGIVLIQPTAPMPLYGVVCEQAKGHVVTTILIGMVAMLFTAISYGRMAQAYPSAGSAYTYVGRELHPALGYLTGWAMIFDYILNPIICVIWCSKAAMNFVPTVPFPAWAVFFAALFTLLNMRGIKASSRTNEIITACLGVVIILFFVAAARYILARPTTGQAASFAPSMIRRPSPGRRSPPGPRSRCSRTSALTGSRRSRKRPTTRAATSCWRPYSSAW